MENISCVCEEASVDLLGFGVVVSPRGRVSVLGGMDPFGGWALGLSIGVLSKLEG